MSWYKAGSVAVTNGSTAVTGTDTQWSTNVVKGDLFQGPDKGTYEIMAVPGDGSITLVDPYRGTTLSGQPYSIMPTQDFSRSLAQQVAAMVTDFANMMPFDNTDIYPAGSIGAAVQQLFDESHTFNDSTWIKFVEDDPDNMHAELQPNIYETFLGKTNGFPQGSGKVGERFIFERTLTAGAGGTPPAAITLSSGAATVIGQLTVPPGEFTLEGVVVYAPDATTRIQACQSGISDDTAAPPMKYRNTFSRAVGVPPVDPVQPCRVRHINITVATTYYLIAYSVFDTANMKAYGELIATRVA